MNGGFSTREFLQGVFTLLSAGTEKLTFRILRNLRIASRARYNLTRTRYSAAKTNFLRPFLKSRKAEIFFACGADRGIGNRMKAIVSHLAYFDAKALSFFWPVRGWVSASFHDLFSVDADLSLREISEAEREDFGRRGAKSIYERIGGGGILFLPVGDSLAERENRYDRLCDATKDAYRKIFAKFHPSEKVMERLRDFRFDGEYVSVQVRRNADWIAAGREDPLEDYVKIMNEFPETTKFFLSAMNKASAEFIRRRFGGRVFELPGKDYSSMTDAVCDMFLLGRGKFGIYSYESTFSEVAWWLGGARQPIRIVGGRKPRKGNAARKGAFPR